MDRRIFVGGIALGAGLVAALAGGASGAVSLYTDIASYQGGGGVDTVLVDFDSTDAETDIGFQTLGGVQFNPNGSPLIVVDAASTFTPDGVFTNVNDIANNTLQATTGTKVLSPGGAELGSDPDLDIDWIEMKFDEPKASVAFDLLFQSLDGATFVDIYVYDEFDVPLFSTTLSSGESFDANAGGVQFYGLISDGALIKTIQLSEYDNDLENPDANIGLDTVRGGIPTPGVGVALGLGIAGLARRRRS